MLSQNSNKRLASSPTRGLESPAKRQRTSGIPMTETELKRLRTLEELLNPAATCCICEGSIGRSVKVRDMSCAPSENIVYCLDCHMKGKTRAGLAHKPDCDYYIFDTLKFPLIAPGWTAEETLRLIQGIMKCGLGNWADVSSQFVRTKGEVECEEFYLGKIYQTGTIAYETCLLERDLVGERHKIDHNIARKVADQIQSWNEDQAVFRE